MLKLHKAMKIVVVNGIVLLLLFLLIEGASSSLLFLREVARNQTAAERRHTQYDPELGWIHKRNIYIPDLYGPGIGLSTNSQAYRNRDSFSRQVPADKVRIICSGDSFTLGFGVDDDHNWCQLLAAIDRRLEPVNMGQGGYGVDQAYLWYKRKNGELEHQIHLFAFITDDFIRMQRDKFEGYGKPFLEIHDGLLVINNTPVPKWSYDLPWLTRNLPIINRLSSVSLLRAVILRVGNYFGGQEHNQQDHKTREVVSRIFTELQNLNRTKQSTLILVYLPTLGDYMGKDESEMWRKFVLDEAARNEILFIDLIEDFQTLPPHVPRKLFSRAHYSVEGNAYIAEILYKKLSALSDVFPGMGRGGR